MRELNGHLENNYLVIKSVVPYENKAVKSYFMDVSRANFYAKLCMKLGAYEKRLWNYFKIMCMYEAYFFFFPAMILVLQPHSFDQPSTFTRLKLRGCFLFQILQLENRLFSSIYCRSQSDSGGFLLQKAVDATSACLCLTLTVKSAIFSYKSDRDLCWILKSYPFLSVQEYILQYWLVCITQTV